MSGLSLFRTKIGPVTSGIRHVNNTTALAAERKFSSITGVADYRTTDGQISVVGVNATDTFGGAGVGSVKITYYDSTFAGPFTETINLNGTTRVDTVNTNYCYIDRAEIVTFGGTTGGFNVYADTVTVIQVLTGATSFSNTGISVSQIGGSSHFVGPGVTCYITEITVDSNDTGATAGGLVTLQAFPVSMGPFNSGIRPFVPSYVLTALKFVGGNRVVSSKYRTPIAVQGPARIFMQLTPEAATSVTSFGQFSYYEVGI